MWHFGKHLSLRASEVILAAYAEEPTEKKKEKETQAEKKKEKETEAEKKKKKKKADDDEVVG